MPYYDEDGKWEPIENDRQILAFIFGVLLAVAIVAAVILGLATWLRVLEGASAFFFVATGVAVLLLCPQDSDDTDPLSVAAIFWFLVWIVSVVTPRFL